MTILSVNGRIFPDVDAYDYWKEKFKARPMRDTVTLPPETPIQPIQQAQHALTIQELKRYLSPDSIDQVARNSLAPGKRSPDGHFREYKYNREIARAVVEHLQLRGYDAELLVPEEEDISLKERIRKANKRLCQLLQKKPFRPKTQTHKCLHLLLNHIS